MAKGQSYFNWLSVQVEFYTMNNGNTEENHLILLGWGAESQEEVQEGFLEENDA